MLFLLTGCGHFLSRQALEEQDPCHIEQLKAGLDFYDLNGATETALRGLNACIEGARDRENSARRQLRAETLLDLIVYGKVVQLVDLEVANEVDRLLVVSLPGYGQEEWQPETVTAERLNLLIEEDLRVSGMPAPYINTALDLLSFDLQGEDPGGEFAGFTHARIHGERLRLLFAGVMTTHLSPWGERPAQTLSWEAYRSISWLCTNEIPENMAELAVTCGYWCVSEEGPADIEEDPELRQLYELTETDALGQGETLLEEEEESSRSQGREVIRPGLRETPGDEGYELVRRCGEAYFSLPEEGDVVLLSQQNYIDMLLLNTVGELLLDLEEDLLGGDPLIRLSATLMDNLQGKLSDLRGPLQLTPAAFHYDPRLALPQLTRPMSSEPWRRVTLHTPLVSALSTGIYVGIVPHVMLRQDARGVYRLKYWGEAEGFHFPGQEVVRFSGLNQGDSFSVQEGFLGELAISLGSVHRWMMGDLDPEGEYEAGNADSFECSSVGIEGISILLDHMTQQSALQAILRTAMGCGVQSFHIYSTDSESRLLTLPIERIVHRQTRTPHHLLEVTEEDSFVLRMEGGEAATSSVSLAAPAPYCSLYRAVFEALSHVEEAAELPLMIVVNSPRFDVGMLVNAINVLSMNRSDLDCEDDTVLFSFSPETPPGQLFSGGLILGI
jgi:hypothetical protein